MTLHHSHHHHSHDAQANPHILSSPDSEARGRKRRRDPLAHFTLPRPQPSRESSTLRGRGRYRSPSRMALLTVTNNHTAFVSTLSSRAVSAAAPCDVDSSRGRDASPEKRRVVHHTHHVLNITLEGGSHRRSPSPSRSTSPGAMALLTVVGVGVRGQRRRRQRTSSRSRRHGLEGAFATRREMGRQGAGLRGWIDEEEEEESLFMSED